MKLIVETPTRTTIVVCDYCKESDLQDDLLRREVVAGLTLHLHRMCSPHVQKRLRAALGLIVEPHNMVSVP